MLLALIISVVATVLSYIVVARLTKDTTFAFIVAIVVFIVALVGQGLVA